jgi:hypothetical protein
MKKRENFVFSIDNVDDFQLYMNYKEELRAQ